MAPEVKSQGLTKSGSTRQIVEDADNSDKGSQLLDLPPEVRLLVYRYVFCTESNISIYRTHRSEHEGLVGGIATPSLEGRRHSPYLDMCSNGYGENVLGLLPPVEGAAILRVSRMVYEEALPVLYGTNIFMFRYATDFEEFVRSSRHGMHFMKQNISIQICAHDAFFMGLRMLVEEVRPGITRFVRVDENQGVLRKRFNAIGVYCPEPTKWRTDEIVPAIVAAVHLKAELQKVLVADGTLLTVDEIAGAKP